jgi:hypothetical protein
MGHPGTAKGRANKAGGVRLGEWFVRHLCQYGWNHPPGDPFWRPFCFGL